ncbi:protein BIG GRAIN 1-like B [Amaranthus tricolor]|uniref:protein BIG GRAIN 1-like B n=1 Tax=Amaranthus tricolor TaxID=29722 RepID=UPI00258B9160|nr:protein BIG GRAIN 1-like B [Amaranthus tricolor]
MYNWEKSKHDSKNSTFSSTFLNKFNKSHKTHHSKTHQINDFNFLPPKPTSTRTSKNRATTNEDEKMEKISSLRRACLVEKWMEKKVKPSSRSSSSSTLIEEFDFQDSLFFNSTNHTTTSSSSSDETDFSVFSESKHNLRKINCFAPSRPKPIKTHSIESKFLTQFGEEKNEEMMKNTSKSAKIYSNLKNLKQPISPGVRLTSFINSLFTKDGKSSKKCSVSAKQSKTEELSYSTCSSASSFYRSCLSKNNTPKRDSDEGIRRTVRFSPVSVIVDDDSQPCGYKSLHEDRLGSHDGLLHSKFGRSLSKRYEELRNLDGLKNQKKLEEVALDLIGGYWDARLNKTQEDEDDDDDGEFSCSSSDLFELDHLSLIGNELPVYETTKFDTKTM